MGLTLPAADAILKARIADTSAFAAVFEKPGVPLASLLAHYLQGTGAQSDHLVHRARDTINRVARAEGVIGPGESVFDQYHHPLPTFVRAFCPEHPYDFYEPAPAGRVTAFPILAPSENDCCAPELPRRVNMVIQNRMRPGLTIYQAAGLDVFVRPYGYQIYSKRQGVFWPSGTSRPFTRAIEQAPEQWVAGHIVIVQDRFDAANFAHFLFDYVTRIGHFAEAGIEDVRNCIFVLGGVPGPFQAMVLNTLSTAYAIPPDRFFFPHTPLNLRTRGDIYWFSDQIEQYVHPAQMAHPRSVGVIRKVAEHLRIEPAAEAEHIYISRKDAGRRRLANEGEVWPILEQRGFRFVTMSEHPIETQIALVRGAKRIIAPHGMGLTQISLHLGRPAVLELFNADIATDAFAFMARAMGFGYDFIAGTPTANSRDDFVVPPESVRGFLDEAGLPTMTAENRRRNLISGSAGFIGTWGPGGQEQPAAPSDAVPPLFAGNVVLRHVRGDPAVSPDSNSGFWWGMLMDGAKRYTASCFVWVPADFAGSQVLLTIGEWADQSWRPADLAVRDQWQRISVSVTAPEAATEGNLVLRLTGPPGAAVFSTAWQLEAGPIPTPYQPTP